jgi:hypothetical protein
MSSLTKAVSSKASPTKKYTVDLPQALYDELKEQADKRDSSMREMLRQCLRFGLIALKIDEDPNADIIFRERVSTTTKDGEQLVETRESRVQFL